MREKSEVAEKTIVFSIKAKSMGDRERKSFERESSTRDFKPLPRNKFSSYSGKLIRRIHQKLATGLESYTIYIVYRWACRSIENSRQ